MVGAKVDVDSRSTSDSMEVDMELMELYTGRIDKCRRARDKLRSLSRKHRLSLAEVEREELNVKAVRGAALEAVEAKRKVLEAELNRRYSAAVAAIMLDSEERKLPLKRRRNALKRSANQVESAQEAVEQKLMQRQHKFLHKFVGLMEDVDTVIRSGAQLEKEENIPRRCCRKTSVVDDFRNLTFKSVKLGSFESGPFDDESEIDDLYHLLKSCDPFGDSSSS